MHKPEIEEPTIYGLMASFDGPDEILAAAERASAEGYTELDAYTPFPVEGLDEAIKFKTKLPVLVFLGGIAGCAGGFLLQYYLEVIVYPKNIGGRPFASWPAFVPPAYELTILAAALTAVFAMILLNGLPQPYHPVFNVPQFRSASKDGYFLVIEAKDPKFDHEKTKGFLESLNPKEVFDVEP
jgi:hypothetical protein